MASKTRSGPGIASHSFAMTSINSIRLNAIWYKVVYGLDSSGFSGQRSKHHQGIAKKDISMPIHRVISKRKSIPLIQYRQRPNKSFCCFYPPFSLHCATLPLLRVTTLLLVPVRSAWLWVATITVVPLICICFKRAIISMVRP